MNLKETAEIVGYLATFHPGWKLTPEQIQGWHAEIGDLEFVNAQAIAREIIRTEPRWPTVADFRHRYADKAGLLAPSPAAAWEEVQQAIAAHGRNGGCAWSHPAVARAVEAIGWWPLCMSSNPDTVRAQFRRAYEEFAGPVDRETTATMTLPEGAVARPLEAPEHTNARLAMEAAAARELEAGPPVAPPASLRMVARNLQAMPDPYAEAKKKQGLVVFVEQQQAKEEKP